MSALLAFLFPLGFLCGIVYARHVIVKAVAREGDG